MEAQYVVCVCLALFNLLVPIASDDLQGPNKIAETYDGPPGGCMFADCSADQVCVYRRFRCRVPPCPGMLYCAGSRTESLRGPATCETVQCPYKHVCMIKVRRCRWDTRCEQQMARCVSLKEFHEGPASCAGFKCPQGKQCILRESFCAKPPCRLLRSCSENREVHLWLGRCRSLNCPSEHECFLRRPENNCISPSCKHEPDCVTTNVDEATSEHCRGWMCPRGQTCNAEVVEPCRMNGCDVKRYCRELKTVARNDSSSFSRRSLRNKSETSEVETRGNESQDELEKGTDTPRSWLDHLNSKTELDAIELWIKNAEQQKDFKQFQEWLRSIKNILDSGSYKDWIEEILSSRGEEFRKWVRASHDSLDLPTTTRAVTENPYPLRDSGTNTSDDLNKRVEEIESFLRDKNLTSILEKILVPNRILLPPHTALETGLLNNLRKSNRSLFFNYLLKYPFYVGNQFLSVQPPKIENTYDRPYLVVPVEHIKDLANAPIVNSDATPKGEQAGNRGNADSQNNLSSTREEPPSLWTLNTKSPVQDSINPPNERDSKDEPRYFDDVPADMLELFLKSTQSIDEKPRERDNSLTIITDEHDQNFEWSSMPRGEVRTDRNEDVTHFSLFGDDRFEADHEPRISIFVDESDDDRSINHSGRLNDVHSSSEPNENDDSDLDLLFALNKDGLLPYIQTLMEVINAEDDQTEPRPDGSSPKNFVNDRAKSMTAELKVTTVERIENDVREPDSVGTVSVQQEKSSEPVSIYPEQETNVRQFYNPPSYGASNAEIPFQDYSYVDYNRTDSKSSNDQ